MSARTTADLGALAPIVDRKRREAAELRCGRGAMFAAAARLPRAPEIGATLRGGAVVAEMKRRSPSGGRLREDLDPARLAMVYQAAGAAGISVLTDGPDFGGSLADLGAARAAVATPLLCKDFVVEAVQVAAARVAGADWVLLIAALFTRSELEGLLGAVQRCGAQALVEAHDEAEVDRALEAGAACLGVNNRDLRTLRSDLSTFERLRPRIPPGPVVVAESGMRDTADVARMRDAGADAVLVGEMLMRASHPAATLATLVGVMSGASA